MTKEQIEAVLQGIRSWPQEDQEELVEIARTIEAHRTGLYIMTDQERAAVREGLAKRIAENSCPTRTWRRSAGATAFDEGPGHPACTPRSRRNT